MLPFQNELKSEHTMRVNLIVDASCAKCQMGKNNDDECLLAVEINSDIYYVEGTTIDDHGDAHAIDGFCNAAIDIKSLILLSFVEMKKSSNINLSLKYGKMLILVLIDSSSTFFVPKTTVGSSVLTTIFGLVKSDILR